MVRGFFFDAMELVNSVLTWLLRKRSHQRELFIRYPHDVQAEWFRKLVATAQHTEFGERFAFADIETVEQFRQRVPIHEYEQLEPYVNRMMRGEQNLLWPSEVKWFAKSSGTTSHKSKFIPVSAESLDECHYKGGKDMLSIFCSLRPDTRIFTGKGLSIGGSHKMNELGGGGSCGDLSAVLLQNLPVWAEFLRTPELEVALMDEWEAKIDRMARITMEQDVTSIQGVPSWTLVLLRRIMELKGTTDLTHVWPNLEVFFHGGVSFVPFRDRFRQMVPSSGMTYLETYNASEGFFGIQDQLGSSDLLLMLDYGIYYEFEPMDRFGSGDTVQLHEVVPGRNYALIISTNGGLWRYRIGDTVQFTCTDPYRIRISGRTRHYINMFGEELIVDNADRAIAFACERTGATVSDYTACPIAAGEDGRGGHQWLIEFSHPPHNMGHFADLLDTGLKSINSDYEAKRYKDMVLMPPEVTMLREGTFYSWLKMKGKLGGQHKVPRLSNDRAVVEEVLSL
jgi:phenylacetate-coenzyme A ligase PaaK-like adenylate-forming protein